MRKTPLTLATIAILALFLCSPIGAEVFYHDLSTGNLTTWDLEEAGDYDIYYSSINTLATSTEYYPYPGFLGRLIYQGDANTLTVFNAGPVATSNNGMFYFTGDGTTNRWREFVLAIRVKGLTHAGGTSDYVGVNYVISSPGQNFPIASAGTGTVAVGELGYNSSGAGPIVRTATNGYQYKYRFAYIWIDVTLMRTNRTRNYGGTVKDYFHTYIQFTGAGVDTVFSKAGVKKSPSGTAPLSNAFSVARSAPQFIPFSELLTKTTMATSYLAGYVSYVDSDARARVYFASNSAGTATDFRFKATIGGTERSFPYYVAYVPVQPSGTTRTINSTTITFPSTSSTVSVYSPISGYNDVYVINGELRIFVQAGLTQYSIPSETYSSNIYCFLTTY